MRRKLLIVLLAHLFFILSGTPANAENDTSKWIKCDELKYQATSTADCDKQLGKFEKQCMNQDNMSMRFYLATVARCEKEASDKKTAQRLTGLKSSDPKQYQALEALNVSYKAALEKFCLKFFDEQCEGSICGSCLSTCRQTLVGYWDSLGKAIEAKTLSLQQKSKLPNASNSNAKHLSESVKEYFSDFGRGICDQPKAVWKNAKVVDACEVSFLQDVATALWKPFDDEEGNVCGWHKGSK